MSYRRERALELLRIGAGLPQAKFREGQEEAIREVVVGQRRLLVVQKTGWGKSFVYFIAVKLLREAGLGGCEEIDFRPDVATAMRVARRGEPRSGREAVIGKREG